MQKSKKIQPAAMAATALMALSLMAGCSSIVVNVPGPTPQIIELTLSGSSSVNTFLTHTLPGSLSVGQWSVSKSGSFPGDLGLQITKSKFYLGVLASNNFFIQFNCRGFFKNSIGVSNITLNQHILISVDNIPVDGKSYPCTVRVYYDIDREYPILTQQVDFSATK
jgi:hypothetical protein